MQILKRLKFNARTAQLENSSIKLARHRAEGATKVSMHSGLRRTASNVQLAHGLQSVPPPVRIVMLGSSSLQKVGSNPIVRVVRRARFLLQVPQAAAAVVLEPMNSHVSDAKDVRAASTKMVRDLMESIPFRQTVKTARMVNSQVGHHQAARIVQMVRTRE